MSSFSDNVTPQVESSAQRQRAYRPDIDGLRAVAIILVVAFHAKLTLLAGGFVGVDVFLVISGYLIGSLVYRDVRNSRLSFLHFYERRAKRILPALLTVLIVCDVIAFVLLSPLELRDYCAQSFSAIASSSNIYYWLRSNYFNPGSIFKPLLMTWSLGIEEQFYLLFPLTLVRLQRFAKRRVFAFVGIICAVSFLSGVICLKFYPAAAFYLLPTRAWELGLGVLIAIFEVQADRPLRLTPLMVGTLGWAGLALIITPALSFTERTAFPGFTALLPTSGTACLVIARNSFVNRRILASRPLVFVGLVSYSWYLWHWPLMSFARIVSGGLLSIGHTVLIAIFSLGLATLSYRFIEQPFRKSITPGRQLLPRYAGALALLGAVPLVGYLQAGWPRRTPELMKIEATVSQVERNPCLADFDVSTPRLTAPCVQGPSPKLALLGDSHAAALGPAVRRFASQHGYGFELLTKASCPPLSGASLRWALHPTLERTCSTFNNAVLQHVWRDPNISVVVLAGFWSAPWTGGSKQDCYSDSNQFGKEVSEEASYNNFHSGLLNAIVLLRSAGKRVFVATDVPRFSIDPVNSVRNSVMKSRAGLAALLSSNILSLSPVPEQGLIKPADAIADREVKRAAVEGGAHIIDLAQNLCPNSNCDFWSNGVLLYADGQHLTPAGAEYALRGLDPITE